MPLVSAFRPDGCVDPESTCNVEGGVRVHVAVEVKGRVKVEVEVDIKRSRGVDRRSVGRRR